MMMRQYEIKYCGRSFYIRVAALSKKGHGMRCREARGACGDTVTA